MTQFSLTDDQIAIRDMASSFAAEKLAPHAVEWDERKHFPVDVMREAAALGMSGVYIRDDVGGLGADPARRGPDLRGAGDGLSDDLRLPVDPQHVGLDDRPLRVGRPAPEIPRRRCAPWSAWRAIA